MELCPLTLPENRFHSTFPKLYVQTHANSITVILSPFVFLFLAWKMFGLTVLSFPKC